MIARGIFFVASAAVGFAIAVFYPTLPELARSSIGWSDGHSEESAHRGEKQDQGTDGHAHGQAGTQEGKKTDHKGEGSHANEGRITLDEEQIAGAGIAIGEVSGGQIGRTITAPGNVFANADLQQRVVGRVSGVLVEFRKRLGETVSKGDVLAVIESREIAEAKSEYLAANRASELAASTLQREKTLWDKKVSAEQEYLQARAAARETQIRQELARQRLVTAGVGDKDIADLGRAFSGRLGLVEVRSPINGRIIDRKGELGAAVSPDAELFVIADLSTVWVEMAFSTAELDYLKEGQKVAVTAVGGGTRSEGEIVFLNPMISRRTRMARAVASVENADLRWRPGDFVSAVVQTGALPVRALVPGDAIQTIEGKSVVFVRNDTGFEKREVVVGRSGQNVIEIVSGLEPGEKIATSATFILKAELGKGEAEHAH